MTRSTSPIRSATGSRRPERDEPNAAVPGGTTVTSGGFLNGPLGLTLAPNGDILTANAGDGFIVETAPTGTQLRRR